MGGRCQGADKPYVAGAALSVPLGHCRFLNATTEFLIRRAYEVAPEDRSAITGLPGWSRSERFDVDAKAQEVTATEAQLWEMLRSLLSERFQLRFRRTTREVSGYKLIIGEDGHKLSTAKPDEPRRFTGRGTLGEVIGRNAPLSELQQFLAAFLDSPVADATGLTGTYDFRLTFSPAFTSNAGAAIANTPDRPSIFTAVREQLGLKLEKERLPVLRYVVDNIQRPSPN